MKLKYLSLAGAVSAVFLAAALSLVQLGNAKSRIETAEFLQATESLQTGLSNARQKLQAQQGKLSKAAAISESVGPAVLGDIRTLAEKSNNNRLRDLLQKYGVREQQPASGGQQN